jgi:hypothetical protein
MQNRDASMIMCDDTSTFMAGYDLTTLVCVDVDDCLSTPCLNGATCVDDGLQVCGREGSRAGGWHRPTSTTTCIVTTQHLLLFVSFRASAKSRPPPGLHLLVRRRVHGHCVRRRRG